MIIKFKQIAGLIIDAVQVNLPWSASVAVVKIAEIKDWVAVVTMLVGTACTVAVTIRKLKAKQDDKQDDK